MVQQYILNIFANNKKKKKKYLKNNNNNSDKLNQKTMAKKFTWQQILVNSFQRKIGTAKQLKQPLD